jgi:hypothetical protein
VYPPPPPAAAAQGWASDPTQGVGGSDQGAGGQPPAAGQGRPWGAEPPQQWSGGSAQQRGAEPTQQWTGGPAQRASDPTQEWAAGSAQPAAEPAQQWGEGPAQQQRDPGPAQQWGGGPAQQREAEPTQQWGSPAQQRGGGPAQQRAAEPTQQWAGGSGQWAQQQPAYQPPATAYQPGPPAYQPGAPAYPAPGAPFRPAEQQPAGQQGGVSGAAIAGGIMAIAGALGIVGACALPVTNASFGGGSISLFKELGTRTAWWYLVEPIGVAALAIIAAIVVMASRGRVVPFAAAGILLGFGIQTAFLFLGYWRGFANGQQTGPAGIVGMLAGVLLVGAGLVAGAAIRRT